LQCDNSPAAAKSEIVPFTISLTGDFQDVTNSIPFRYYQPTKIFSIYPRYGPKDGETIVQIWGENFLNFDENTRCAFGTKSVAATFINSNYMLCVAPFSDVVEKPIPFTVSLNNQQNSKDTLFYWYYSQPAITELIPDRGPDTGGTQILLKGRNFHPFRDNSMIANYNDTFCMFEDIGKVPAVIINSTKVQCLSPPSYVLR
jgi:IPT/TIG domain